MLIATTMTTGPAPISATSAIASKMAGTAITASITRISTMSRARI